jgi:fructokinase
MFEVDGPVDCQIESLARRFDLRVVALTRGPEGSLLYQGGRWSDCPAEKVAIKDTVGAGDAFTAALCLGLLGGMDLDEIHAAAGRVAAFVCSCAGATPPLPTPLRELFARPSC